MRNDRRAVTGLLGLAVLASIGLGCATVQVSSGPSTMTYPALTLDSLRRAGYPCDLASSGKVYLQGGTYTEPLSGATDNLLHVNLLDQWTAFGDLDGDGNKDAIVILTTQGRGSNVYYDLVAMVNSTGTPQAAASLRLGDRIKINTVAIMDGKIIIDVSRQGPNDPQSDPRDRSRETYKLVNGELSLLDRTVIPR